MPSSTIPHNKLTEKRNRNSVFYTKCVPVKLRQFLTRDDFYSSLSAVIQFMSQTSYTFKPNERAILKLRFSSDMPVSQICKKLGISRSKYNATLANLAGEIYKFYSTEVSPYPLRIAILKTRNLKRKVILKRLFQTVSISSYTLKLMLEVFKLHHWPDEKHGGYHDLIQPYRINEDTGNREFSDADIKYLNNLYLTCARLCKRIAFRGHIRATDGTSKEELRAILYEIDHLINKHDTRILF